MKPAGVALIIFFGIVALSTTAWLGMGVPKVKPPAAPEGDEDYKHGQPEISKTGPWPKLVLKDRVFDFGVMEVGSAGKHTFLIRNEGDAPLEIVSLKEGTCSCTIGNIPGDGKIPPGGEAEVELTWQIKTGYRIFRHQAFIRTNDPKEKKVSLEVTGRVETVLELLPTDTWNVGILTQDKPAEAVGDILSTVLDKFEIVSSECPNDKVKVEFIPLNEAQLAERTPLLKRGNLESPPVLSGYQIKVAVLPGTPVGRLRETVSFKTMGRNEITMKFNIEGERPGPIRVIGSGWIPDLMALNMGEFPAAKGRTSELRVIFRDWDGKIELLKPIEIRHNSVTAELIPIPGEPGSKVQHFTLKITVPPGEPQNRLEKKAEFLMLELSHPDVPQLKIPVTFLST